MSRGTTTQSGMKKLGWFGLALASVVLLLMTGPHAAAQTAGTQPREAGIWFDDSGLGAVEILPCGKNLCGRTVWLKNPLNAEGKPLVDRHNPNPARQTTPICGLSVIGGVQAMSDGTWDQGWIYDPKTGSAYDVALQLVAPDKLKVTGYKGVKLFSKSFLWTRAPADLPRCGPAAGASEAAASPPAAAAKKQAAPQKPASAPQQKATSQSPPAPKPATVQKPAAPAAAQQKAPMGTGAAQKPAPPSPKPATTAGQ